MQHYQTLINRSGMLIWNSVFTAALSSLLSTTLAAAIALRLATASGKLKAFLLFILLLNMVSPPFLFSLSYIQLYGRGGWITYHLLGLSLNPYNWQGVVIMQTIGFTPMGALLLLGIVEKVDGSLLQSARNLGASSSRAVRDVLFPLIFPGILAVFLLTFMRALGDFATPIVIGGRFNTVASEIYMQVIGYSNLSYASALNILIFIPAIMLFIVYRFLMKRSSFLLGSGIREAGGDSRVQIKGAFSILTYLLTAIFFIATSLQYICIFLSGFLKSVKGEYFFTLEHLERFLRYDAGSIVRSVQYALIVAVGGTLFAMLLSYYIERRKVPCKNFLDFIATMPYIIPGTCFGIGYIIAFNSAPLKLTGTAAIVIINMLFRQLPNTTKLCSASLSQIPYSLEDAARDLGASRLKVIRDIIIPNLRRAFFSGFVYNFTSAMTTAGAILFLIHPSQKVIVFRLFDAITTGDYGIASLISTFIIVITLTVNLVFMLITRDKRQGGANYVLENNRAE